MRALLRSLLSLAMVAGLILAVWPLGQTLYGHWNQRSLAAQWQRASQPKAALQKQKAAKPTTRAAGSPALTSLSRAPRKKARWPLTKLSIPDIDLETFVVQGMDSAALRRGPGHDVNSSLPGTGNCVIAGHRNVYGSFFYRLDELMAGAPIVLENEDGRFTYTVNTVFVTPDTNLTVLQPPAPGAPPVLTLITCTLPHTNNRIVLQADLSAQ
ncbi:MAG TPA: class E sortase [Abditibacterium sp.]|jgi:sortase A